MFKSVLFPDGKSENTGKIPPFFNDLNLDSIVDGMTVMASNEVRRFFYCNLANERDIEYRQQISQDLERTETFNTILEFTKNMKRVHLFLERRDKLRHRYQKERWFLDAVLMYCRTVRTLQKFLFKCNLRSEGLLGFRQYIDAYTRSEKFTTLCQEAKKVEKRLSEIRYVLYIKENKVRVQKYNSQSDYSVEIMKVFEKFKRESAKDYRVDFNEMLDVNHVEAKILDFVGEIYSEVFSELEIFGQKHANFQDKTIARFENEVQFYLSYLEYISPLKKAGMNFCYPHFSSSKKIDVQNLFDLSLAQKLLNEGRKVVCNDFTLKENERIVVVTGPNQGGKTTFVRALGQNLYLGTLGLPIPARRAEFFTFDKLFTHFEKEENVNDLHGKLEDDLLRIHEILEMATNKSIVIMNEIFSSTTLDDALLLGRKVLREIDNLGAIAILVTFMDELSKYNERTVSMVSKVDEKDPNIRTYKILRMPANGLSYAVSLAKKYALTYEQLKERMKR